MKKYLLELIVFFSGAALMVFELVGSRIFAPFLGTSLIVWTSLIGVIMGSLSLGYFLGGKLSDRYSSYRALFLILFFNVFAIGFTMFLQYVVLVLLQNQSIDLRISSLIAALILFAPASVLFGMVSPYAIKLKLKDLEHTGERVGSIYAISTLGSIFGTFFGGFFLIPFLGTMKILVVILVIMFCLAVYTLIVSKNFRKKDLFLMFFMLSFILANSAFAEIRFPDLIDIDTQYNRILIFDTVDKKTKRPIRLYTTDPHGSQSAIFLDKNDDLVFDYLKFYRLSEHFNPELKKALMIGGGAFTYPRDFLKRNSEALMDIVEIDGELEKIAKKYFEFQDDKRLKIFNEDGRVFLNRNQQIYDSIFIDAFSSKFSIPFHLTTKEAVEKIYNSLSDQGVVIANIISALEGERAKFLKAEFKTYKEIFPQVYIFQVNKDEEVTARQNLILLVLKSEELPSFSSEDDELSKYLNSLWEEKIAEDIPVLIDDYAPVEFYSMKF